MTSKHVKNLFKDRDWPIVVCFANQKGGVGKTTLAVQFALYCHEVLKKKVLCIDLDHQGDFTQSLSDKDEIGNPVLGESLTTELFNPEAGDVNPIETSSGIHLIGTTMRNTKLLAVEELPVEEAYYSQEHLNNVFPNFDVVVMDCPPLPGRTMRAALFMAHYVITPIGFGGYGINGVSFTSDMTEEARKAIENITGEAQDYPRFLGAVINLATKVNEAQEFADSINQKHPDLFFKNVIGNRDGLKNASFQGKSIWSQRYQHVAGAEMLRLFEEAFSRIVENEKAIEKSK